MLTGMNARDYSRLLVLEAAIFGGRLPTEVLDYFVARERSEAPSIAPGLRWERG